MILIASLLPKNAFSLRWLALSSCCFNGGADAGAANGSGRFGVARMGRLFGRAEVVNAGQISVWLALAGDSERVQSSSYNGDNEECTTMWNAVVEVLERNTPTINTIEYSSFPFSTILESIPRGGSDSDSFTQQRQYAGLVNLGNTCYLNSQLQCAYHVPYLRKLVLDARDESVEVEVEVEIEVDVEVQDDGSVVSEDVAEGDGVPVGEETVDSTIGVTGDDAAIVGEEVTPDDVVHEENQDVTTLNAEKRERSEAEDTGATAMDDANAQGASSAETTTTKQIIRKTELRTETRPISNALRALQHTFVSLTPRNGQSASSGTTQALCRSLGINPFIQQDGQEFWKLFVPELNYDKMTQLYSGYFDDYVREILPESDNDSNCEEKKDEEGDHVGKPRERVRTEQFLDLSIPVAEGMGGSVESTLREMFTQPEILKLSEGNGWRPSKGADKVDAYKGSSLKRDGLPSVLQLHLKRFKYDWETGETSKINDRCSFPLKLDLSEISEPGKANENEANNDVVYDLQSIVIHRGEYGSGHYYSYVRPDIRSNEWYRFDDQIVTKVEFNDVVADAYGGRVRRKRSRSLDESKSGSSTKQQRGLLRRIFSFGGRLKNAGDGAFGYGGITSSAYMLQYVRRSDIPTLYLE